MERHYSNWHGFRQVLKEGRIRRRHYPSWHAFRHSLQKELADAGVRESVCEVFMGCRSSGGSMPARYAQVSLEEADRAVMKKHPFLKYWL